MSRSRQKMWKEARNSEGWISELTGLDAVIIRQGCRTKMCHDNALQALQAARHAEAHLGERQVMYSCPVCGFTHLGNPIPVFVLTTQFEDTVTYRKKHNEHWQVMVYGQTLANVGKEETAKWQVKFIRRMLADALGKILNEMCPEVSALSQQETE